MEIREMFSRGRQRKRELGAREEEGAEGGEGIDSLSSVKEEAHSALAILYERVHTCTNGHTQDESLAKENKMNE